MNLLEQNQKHVGPRTLTREQYDNLASIVGKHNSRITQILDTLTSTEITFYPEDDETKEWILLHGVLQLIQISRDMEAKTKQIVDFTIDDNGDVTIKIPNLTSEDN